LQKSVNAIQFRTVPDLPASSDGALLRIPEEAAVALFAC
jgi:hypothetical protein